MAPQKRKSSMIAFVFSSRVTTIHSITVIFIGLQFLAGPAQAAASCEDDLFCISDVATEAGIECRAKNRSSAPITFTLKISAANLAGSRDRIVTETLEPNTILSVLTFEPRGGGRRGKYCYNFKSTIGNRNAAHDDEHIYRFPYESGKSFGVLQGYGSRFSHTGREQYSVDFNMPEGTPVLAARGGIVADYEESNSIGCWDDDCGKYANFVVIAHDDGTTGEYYHLQLDGVLVERGERSL